MGRSVRVRLAGTALSLVIVILAACSSEDPTPTPIPEPTATPNPIEHPDVQAAIATLERDFEMFQTSNADGFLDGCDPRMIEAGGGRDAVKASLQAKWPPPPQDDRAENIELVSHDPKLIVLAFDFWLAGEFVTRVEDAIIPKHEGRWWSNAPDCDG